MDQGNLDALSTKELHDRALETAAHRADVGFLWDLVKSMPAAEAAAGNIGSAETDIASLRGLIADVTHSGEGELGEALRPLFIAYLAKHG